MGGPKISARVASQPVALVLSRDVLKKIFIGRDAQRRRSGPPFDVKSTVRLDLGKIGDRPCVGNNVPVAHNAAYVTADNGEQGRTKCDPKFLHGVLFTNEMKPAPVLDSRISNASQRRGCGRTISLRSCWFSCGMGALL